MKRLEGVYRGFSIFEKDNEWKIEIEGKSMGRFEKIDGVDGKASCMCEIDRVKREERKEIDANIQRVDAQVRLDKNIMKARNNGI